MPARYTPGQVKQLFDVVDVNLSGQLDYDEFLSALRINIRPSSGGVALSDSWRAVVIEHVRDPAACLLPPPLPRWTALCCPPQVTSVLYSFSSELQALFTTRDVDGRCVCARAVRVCTRLVVLPVLVPVPSHPVPCTSQWANRFGRISPGLVGLVCEIPPSPHSRPSGRHFMLS